MKPLSRPLIAVVSQIPLSPVTAGNRARALALLKTLQSLGYDIVFIQIPSFDGDEIGDVEAHEKIVGAGNYYIVRDTSFLSRCTHRAYRIGQRALRKVMKITLPKLDLGYQESVDFRISRHVCRAVATIVENRGIDICVIEYVMHSMVLNYLPRTTKKIIDTHDLFSNRHRKFTKDGLPHGFWVSMTEGEEAKGLRRADAILAIQTSEELHFRQILGEDETNAPVVKAVGHFLEIASVPLVSQIDHRLALICSNNPANLEGYFLFLNNVLPIVLQSSPAFRLLVAGSICGAIPDHLSVDKFGIFEKIEDVFARAPAALNPVVSGSGVSIKILEALACGVPVASTATGARGLAGLGESGILVSRDHDFATFARHIVRLTSDASWRNAEGLKAYEVARRWNEQQRAALLDVLRT